MKTIRIAVLFALVAGGSAAMASPAQADDLSGTYSATATSSAGETKTVTWVLNPCGPDCRTLIWGSSVEEMHLQGSTWSSTDSNGCVTVVDGASLTGSFTCPPDAPVSVRVTKIS